VTVAAQNSKVIYAGDGVSTSFAIPFAFADQALGSDVWAYTVDPTGVVAKLANGYTVNVNAKTVTYPNAGSPLAVGWQFILLRVEPLSQLLALTDTGPVSMTTIMKAFDLLVMIGQQLQEQLNRCVMLPLNTPENSTSPVIAPTSGVLVTYTDTYANLKVIALAAPTVKFWGYATDQNQLYFYTGQPTIGDQGFVQG
jgi:hypothetical protein